MNSRRPEATVHILSSTAAEVHVGDDVEEVVAPDSLALRDRLVEEIRQLAASAGEPAHATLVEGSSRWPMVVHPDGTYSESLEAATAETPQIPDAAQTPGAAVVRETAHTPTTAQTPATAMFSRVPFPARRSRFPAIPLTSYGSRISRSSRYRR